MLKTAMFIGDFAVSASAVAQDASPASQTAPVTQSGQTDVRTSPQGPAIPGAPVSDAPVDATAPPTDVAQDSAAAAPAPAATPVTGASQIAQVVGTEFPAYDKNGDKALDKAEFGAWMVALKTASDPATRAADPATVKWVAGAFASADADRSKQVSQAELTRYLSKGAG